MRHILLLLEFDGTDYHGWQQQHGLRTVQGELDSAITQMTGNKCVLRASSRTDAGVHARGLPVLFAVDTPIPLLGLKRGLNSILPSDLAVIAATEVSESFHVRQSASGKIYRYHIWNGQDRAPLICRSSWYVRAPLDTEAMQCAADSLLGEHDFSSFRAASCQSKSTIRRITRCSIERMVPSHVTIEVEGNAFLQYMVRIMVGTLVEVGRGHQPASWVSEVLAAQDRKLAGPTAPPHGLCLHQVIYKPSPLT